MGTASDCDTRLEWAVLQDGAVDESEVTVYVKGFLSEGETADAFDAWRVQHEQSASRLCAPLRLLRTQ